MCTSVLPVHMCAWCPQRSEHGVRSSGTGVMMRATTWVLGNKLNQILSKSSKCFSLKSPLPSSDMSVLMREYPD